MDYREVEREKSRKTSGLWLGLTRDSRGPMLNTNVHYPIYFPTQPYKQRTIIIPILKMWKLRFNKSNDLLKVMGVEPAFEPYCLWRIISLTLVCFFCPFAWDFKVLVVLRASGIFLFLLSVVRVVWQGCLQISQVNFKLKKKFLCVSYLFMSLLCRVSTFEVCLWLLTYRVGRKEPHETNLDKTE